MIFDGPTVRNLIASGVKNENFHRGRRGQDWHSDERLIRRLASGLDSAEDGRCWLWTKATNRSGYGLFGGNSTSYLAHRLAFRLSGKEIPQGFGVLHTCDTPGCINPSHLYAGTQADNMRDCRDRGRMIRGYCVGEAHGRHVLKEQHVKEIMNLLSINISQDVIGRIFEVSQGTVSNIKNGKNWKYLTAERGSAHGSL